MLRRNTAWAVLAALSWCYVTAVSADDKAASADGKAAKAVARPAAERYAALPQDEAPDFRKHVIPLAGRLGCNGRSCHGSFQGQGGFMLSLFGYDFDNDLKQLMGEGDSAEPRVNAQEPAASLVLTKPTMVVHHDGGQRMKVGGWEYNLLLRWIQDGARGVAKDAPEFVRLDVQPSEILFSREDETVQLKVEAVWSDGSREDVTCLCRFQSNSSQVAEIDELGKATAKQPGDTHVVVFYDNGVQPIPVIRPVSDKFGPHYPAVPAPTQVDELVVQKLRKLGIVPSELANDSEFLRRVSLDLTGTLPTASEVEAFVADGSPDKRARKIDELLERPGYAAWWTTLLCDFTGNNGDVLNNTVPNRNTASQEWYDWIYKRVAENEPYDKLVEGIVLATSRNENESFREYCENLSAMYNAKSKEKPSFADRDYMPHYWSRTNFRLPEDRVIGFAYAFLGIRIQCAQCHKHPFDQWTKQDFDAFKGFLTQVTYGQNREARDEYDAMLKELGVDTSLRGNLLAREIDKLVAQGKTVPYQELYVTRAGAPGRGRGPAAREARLLGSDPVDLSRVADARQPLMDWLRSPSNPYFARAFVNRVWANYFNVGIVEPPDDLSLANPPSNRALLDHLTEGFIASGYDMKWVHREILNSRTYQLSWKPNDTNRLDEVNFSRAIPRRLPAEVAVDALAFATVSDQAANQMVLDLSNRAIAVPASGRRLAGGRSGYALSVFGRSTRESNCDCDRSMEASLLQTVYLQNDNDVLDMITRRGSWLSELGRSEARPAGNEGANAAPQPGGAREQFAQLARQLERARKEGNNRQVARIQERMRDLRRRQGNAPAQPAPQPAPAAAANLDPSAAVTQAYLRTVSRYPTDSELQTALEYINESSDKLAGVRDVLWSLINTKEFIVNH